MSFQDELKAISPINPEKEYMQSILLSAKSSYEYDIKESIKTAVKNNHFQQLDTKKVISVFVEIRKLRDNFKLETTNKPLKYSIKCINSKEVTTYLTELTKLAQQDNIHIRIAFKFKKFGGGTTFLNQNSIIHGDYVLTSGWKAGVICEMTI